VHKKVTKFLLDSPSVECYTVGDGA
jgi:hypothetical protein